MHIRNAITIGLGGALLAVTTGCGDGDTALLGPSASAEAPTSPIVVLENEFTDEQLKDYAEALRRFNEYDARSERFWAVGKATPEALAFFDDYFVSGRARQNQLKSHDEHGVRIQGLATVLWSVPEHIDHDFIVIRQCIDATHVLATQRGVKLSGAPKHPIVRRITLRKPDTGPYLIEELEDGSSGDTEQCDGPKHP